MRRKERIRNFMDKVDLRKLTDFPLTEEGIKTIERDKELIIEVWEQTPNLRFSQILIKMEIIPNMWFHQEEPDILIKQGVQEREVYLWGVNFDKEMNRLPKTDWRLIKDLTTEHIEAIIDGGFVREGSKYYGVFKRELEYRNK